MRSTKTLSLFGLRFVLTERSNKISETKSGVLNVPHTSLDGIHKTQNKTNSITQLYFCKSENFRRANQAIQTIWHDKQNEQRARLRKSISRTDGSRRKNKLSTSNYPQWSQRPCTGMARSTLAVASTCLRCRGERLAVVFERWTQNEIWKVGLHFKQIASLGKASLTSVASAEASDSQQQTATIKHSWIETDRLQHNKQMLQRILCTLVVEWRSDAIETSKERLSFERGSWNRTWSINADDTLSIHSKYYDVVNICYKSCSEQAGTFSMGASAIYTITSEVSDVCKYGVTRERTSDLSCGDWKPALRSDLDEVRHLDEKSKESMIPNTSERRLNV